ncbi:hypothetical protein DFH06DRAFT_475013 [Mycena polygramma]|nr:hypothetical protein DFH06DRAFT_475013 [Mycena polygramma]
MTSLPTPSRDALQKETTNSVDEYSVVLGFHTRLGRGHMFTHVNSSFSLLFQPLQHAWGLGKFTSAPSYRKITDNVMASLSPFSLRPLSTTPQWKTQRKRHQGKRNAAAAKLWAVYVSEAEKYDKGLVESWRSDMEGMLIFAGLFSASLTAFLIESYKTLVPNSGDTTALLLAQISQQLAASSNGTSFVVTSPAPFAVPTSSLICNVLWFLSLGLSLTCALVATLLEQWARDFLHRADMRSAPVIRARVFSFLYYGLRRFQMHTVVEIIPLMLHASLFLFFVGLVPFLVPVNAAITAVAGIILGTVTAVYTLLTLLPLFHLDCPYRTPLSGGLWHLLQKLRAFRQKWHQNSLFQPPERQTKTIVEGIFQLAVEPSDERFTRDKLALLWTVKSLTDDNELEPFIEAIPDIIRGPNTRPPTIPVSTSAYDDYMRVLMNDHHVQLLHRLDAFHSTCRSGLLTLEAQNRRQLSVCKAVWALGALSAPGQSTCRTSIPRHEHDMVPEVIPYAYSAVAIQDWANFRAARDLVAETLLRLHACMEDMKANRATDRNAILECMNKLREEYGMNFGSNFHLPDCSIATIQQGIDAIYARPTVTFLNYLFSTAESDSGPYRFDTTLNLITPPTKIRVSADLQLEIESCLDYIVRNYGDKDRYWMDAAFRLLASYWDPDDTHRTFGKTCLPLAVVQYLNIPRRHAVALPLGWALSANAWRCMPRTIDRQNGSTPSPEHLSDSLTAVWSLLKYRNARISPRLSQSTLEEILHSISQAGSSIGKCSALAVVKRRLLVALRSSHSVPLPELISRFQHPLLPQQTLALVPDLTEGLEQISRNLGYRCDEGLMCTLIEFVESCCSTGLPYKAVETLQCVTSSFLPRQIHPTHQLRFVAALKDLLETNFTARDALVQALIIRTELIFTYDGKILAWLTDYEARSIMKGIFVSYLAGLLANDAETNSELCRRVEQIVKRLDISTSCTEKSPESTQLPPSCGSSQAN